MDEQSRQLWSAVGQIRHCDQLLTNKLSISARQSVVSYQATLMVRLHQLGYTLETADLVLKARQDQRTTEGNS